MRIYLDHNATTPLAPEVLEAMLPWLRGLAGNPAAACEAARPAREAVAWAREQVAALAGCEPDEVVFTAGGTEADNAALTSAWNLQPQRRVLAVSATEHSAVWRCAEALVKRRAGGRLVRLPVHPDGQLDLQALAAVLEHHRDDIALLSVHWANNETGVLQPVDRIVAACREAGVPSHSDAVQALGKVALGGGGTGGEGPDFVSLAAHKLRGPQGVGALVVRRGMRFEPLLHGGGQEQGRRSGTTHVAGVVGFGRAAALAGAWLAGEGPRRQAAQRDRLEQALLDGPGGIAVNGAGAPRVPNTTNLRFDGCEAEALLLGLDHLGLCCSAGSACSSHSLEPSTVLLAMGLDRFAARSSLRFSLGADTLDTEIDRAIELVRRVVGRLREAPAGFPVRRGLGGGH